jgi:hypothetical protein
MDKGQVDSETTAADLPPDIQALGPQRFFDRHLKGRISLPRPILTDLAPESSYAALGIVEVGTQHPRPDRLDPTQVYIARMDGTYQDYLLLGSGNGNVQSSLTALHIQGAEAHGKLTLLIRSVAYADDDSVTLITLHVLQVLDEKGFASILPEGLLHVGTVAAKQCQFIQDGELLPLIEGNHAEGLIRVLLKKLEHETSGLTRLGRIVASSASGMPATVGHELKLHSRCAIRVANAGKRRQLVRIEVVVRESDQRLAPAAVMPS